MAKIQKKTAHHDYVSFDVLDEMIKVTDTRAWLGLFGIAALLILGIMWMIYGKVPSKVLGTGMLLNISGIEVISSNVSGTIHRLDIKVGNYIKKGQPIAYISQINMSNEVESTKKKIIELKSTNTEKQKMRISLEQQYNEQLNSLNKKKLALEKLLSKGIVVEKDVLDTMLLMSDIKRKIEDFKIELLNDENQLNLLKRELAIQEQRLLQESIVTSPFNGKVIELQAEIGSVITPGSNILTIESDTGSANILQAIVFVSALEAKKISLGMNVLILPTNIKPEEYGFIIGKVAYISSYPATSKGMMHILHNEDIVKMILEKESQVEVHVSLERDPETYSKYKWTLKNGPPIILQSGTLCNARITTKEIHPIDFILPKIRSYTDIGVE